MADRLWSSMMAPFLWSPEQIAHWRGGVVSGRLLKLASYAYRFVVGLRNSAFDWGLMRVRKASVPIISVGNLAVGGTGKTAVVAFLAERLREKRVAIVTRGHGNSLRQLPHRVLPGESAARVGDEPAMLARRFPDIPVVVSTDRWEAVSLLGSKVDIILLDDGFQHRWLGRDLDIVVLAPMRTSQLLPFGDLREPSSSLKRASLLWFHDDGIGASPELDALVCKWPGIPVVRSRYRARKLHRLFSTQATLNSAGSTQNLAPQWISGKRVFVLAAIARGYRVSSTVGNLGGQVVGSAFLADHHPLGWEVITAAYAKAEGAQAEVLLITEKDSVKLNLLPEISSVIPLIVLTVEVEIVEGLQELDKAMERLLHA